MSPDLKSHYTWSSPLDVSTTNRIVVYRTGNVLFKSTDEGAHWIPLKSNYPTASVYDIKFVKKSHDLVIATHGRGLFVMDDITPLEDSGANLGKGEFHLYATLPALNWHNWSKHGFASGGFTAPNPLSGAVITYYLPAEIKVNPEQRRRGAGQTPVKITISDSSRQGIRTMYGPATYGGNRTSSNLRYDGPKRLASIQPDEP